QGLTPLRAIEIDGKRALSPIEYVEGERVAMPEVRSHPTRIVSSLDTLDLEHFRPQVGEDRAGKGPGKDLSELQHPDSLQGRRPGMIILHPFPPLSLV